MLPFGSQSVFDRVTGFLASGGGSFAYGGAFALLFVAGWLLPLPEEATVIAAGYVVARNDLNLAFMIACAVAGVMCGDLVIYHIGRRHGDWVFRLRLFRWMLPASRLEKARRLFAEHGSKMAFFGRFITGIRLVVFFTAGNLGVPLGTFVVYDFLAILLTIPIGVVAGHYFADHIDQAFRLMRRSHWVLVGAGAAFLAFFVVRRYLRRRALARRNGVGAREAAREAADIVRQGG